MASLPKQHRISPDYDIVIVGAGLVGASLAAAIIAEPENGALSIALIDKDPAPPSVHSTTIHLPQEGDLKPSFDPRVVALTPHSIQLLGNIGVWPLVPQKFVCPYRAMCVWDDEGTGEINFDATSMGYDSLGSIIENSRLLNALLEKIECSQQVSILRGKGVSALTLEQHYHLHLGAGDADQQQNQGEQIPRDGKNEISAHLVVAADGGRSRIRELANIATREWSYRQQAIVTTIKTEKSHQNTAWQNFLSTGPLALLPLAHDSEQYSAIVWSADSERADELMAMNDDHFKHALTRASESRLGEVSDVAERFCFPLVQRHAIDYIAPQLALVGDAAHTIHPLAGQGVNLGIADIHALSQEITRASKRGLALNEHSLLRRYQRQRKGNNLDTMLMMEGFKRLFGQRDLPTRWLRNSGLCAVNQQNRLKQWMAKHAMGL